MSSDTTSQLDTQAEIMEATYRALCEHGYADLTIQAIADEFPKSKSLLYYHYDTKDEILIAFLGYMLDEFTIEDTINTEDSPDEQLWTLIDELLPASLDDEQRESQVALFELRSRALSDTAYSDQFARADHLIYETLETVLTAGVDDGTFRDVDVEMTVELLVSNINGAMLRRATTTEDLTTQTRMAITGFVDSYLLAE